MKINNKILSLPPYVSTSWRDVQSLHQKDGVLVISLLNGENVLISGLSEAVVDSIFTAHAAFLEDEVREEEAHPHRAFLTPENFSSENVGDMLQHNPEQAHIADLPQDMLHKIADVAKLIEPEDPDQLPKAEPHCNCMYCQIARVISNASPKPKKETEEPVDDRELTFQQWDVTQAGQALYTVTNRLDPKESYRVFLGNPIGCTCGGTHCEHLIEVLKS
jgi:hypothetical protein